MNELLPYLRALGGSVILATAIAAARYLYMRRQYEKQLADSLRGEIKGIREQLRLVASIANCVVVGSGSENPEGALEILDQLSAASEIQTPIFDANIQRIGNLWQKMSREVVEFYTDVNGIRLIGKVFSKAKGKPVSHMVDWIRHECVGLAAEATVISERLLQQVKTSYPGHRESRQKAAMAFKKTWLD